jgi:hypothetical protein
MDILQFKSKSNILKFNGNNGVNDNSSNTIKHKIPRNKITNNTETLLEENPTPALRPVTLKNPRTSNIVLHKRCPYLTSP